jgi:hypothetical protein
VTLLEECCGLRSMLRNDNPDILLAQHELALACVKDRQTKKAIDLLEVVVTNTFGTWAMATKLRLHIPYSVQMLITYHLQEYQKKNKL